MQTPYKYEFTPAVVQYLLRAVNAQQLRGEQQAQDLMQVLGLLRKPLNVADLEKEQLESLKAKYEGVADEKPE
jgi:hypothetical protein